MSDENTKDILQGIDKVNKNQHLLLIFIILSLISVIALLLFLKF